MTRLAPLRGYWGAGARQPRFAWETQSTDRPQCGEGRRGKRAAALARAGLACRLAVSPTAPGRSRYPQFPLPPHDALVEVSFFAEASLSSKFGRSSPCVPRTELTQ